MLLEKRRDFLVEVGLDILMTEEEKRCGAGPILEGRAIWPGPQVQTGPQI